MPGGDRTGPMGFGPMTGRAVGFCAGYSAPGYMNPVAGRGYRSRSRGFRGRDGGRGWRNWYSTTGLPGWARAGLGFLGPAAQIPSAEQELTGLKQQADFMQDSLSRINKRIEHLENESRE